MNYTKDIDLNLLPDQHGYKEVQEWACIYDSSIESNRLLIVGASGSGKTRAATDRLYAAATQEEHKRTVYKKIGAIRKQIGLRDGKTFYEITAACAKEKGMSVFDYVAQRYEDEIYGDPEEVFKRQFLTFPRFNLWLNQNTACKGCKILESYLDGELCDDCEERVYDEEDCNAFDMAPGNEIIVIDDLQDWNTKQALTFLKDVFDSKDCIVTLQIPEVFDMRTLKAWLIERFSGYKGTLQLDAEGVVRRLLEPRGLTVIEMKKNK